jgi:hypothetical protein
MSLMAEELESLRAAGTVVRRVLEAMKRRCGGCTTENSMVGSGHQKIDDQRGHGLRLSGSELHQFE